ncbi:MAG: hypothetical protein Q9190_000569 [Brigantiaea leucoxantha]
MAGGGAPDPKHGQFLGPPGNFGGRPQKGIITYTLSANRQRPLAGTMQAAVFNTYRRARSQFLYVVPPFIIAYVAMNWAIEKNEYYNSKEGRMKDAEEAAAATAGGPVRA